MAILYTTFALKDDDIPAPVLHALRENIDNHAIVNIVILTESDINSVLKYFNERDRKKIILVQYPSRPTFRDMFDEINRGYSNVSNGLSVLVNSDISIPSYKTVLRLEKSINEVSKCKGKVAFSLTRYESHNGVHDIQLNSPLGLPNVLSSDAWVFNSRIECKKDLFYSLGQMYCDKFINHDLIESGYKLYNPCLNCQVIHNESSIKDASYYKNLGDQNESREFINKHWRLSVKKGGNYYGLCRISTTIMSTGYLPEPISFSNSRKKIFVFNRNGCRLTKEFITAIQYHLEFVLTNDVDLYFVSEEELSDDEISGVLSAIKGVDNIYIYSVKSIKHVINRLAEGVHDTFDSIIYTRNIGKIAKQLMDLSGTVFLDLYAYEQVDLDKKCEFSEKTNTQIKNNVLKIKKLMGVFRFMVDKHDSSIDDLVVITKFGDELSDKVQEYMSIESAKPLLLCTEVYAQYLYDKYGLCVNREIMQAYSAE